MKRATKIGEAIINGRPVSFFTPPHDEPDFLWVDMQELARAFVPRDVARRLLSNTQRFDQGGRVATTARNGSKIATIVPHPIAQAVVGAMDHMSGHPDDGGPFFSEYCRQAARFSKDHSPMSLDDMLAAFKNSGGPFLAGNT
ncbi:hypothetical protein JI664_12625 [Rhodobacter sp. NTK016B]|uniref:hypothetical protein n=1 Tax=Rhodobacter sp. NTK016B TaxID=2759676 RepID=UPI001A8CA63E|nr:hypothetical protein [Rhodobacter sp. NTK016B]MBN8292811.1 hypothetical protein [Rhodobacter sp. NTK016B]